MGVGANGIEMYVVDFSERSTQVPARRQGWLSNLHLSARDPANGGFVMLGKTFKGMTDELLAWQTKELLARETHLEGHVVHVRPELVVEIAFNDYSGALSILAGSRCGSRG